MKKTLFFIFCCLFGISNPSLGMEVGEPLTKKVKREISEEECKELKGIYDDNGREPLFLNSWILSKNKNTLSDFLKGISQWCSIEASDEEIVQYKDLFFLKIKPDYMRPPFDDLARKISYLYGPNCFNAALVACGFFTEDQFRYVGDEFGYLIEQYFDEIDPKESQLGDIVTYYEKNEFYSEIVHAGIKICNDLIFSKEGPNECDGFVFQEEETSQQRKYFRLNKNKFSCRKTAVLDIEKEASEAFLHNKNIDFKKYLEKLKSLKEHAYFSNKEHIFALNSLIGEAQGNLEKKYKIRASNDVITTVFAHYIIAYKKKNKEDWNEFCQDQEEGLMIGDKIKFDKDLVKANPLYVEVDKPYEIVELL